MIKTILKKILPVRMRKQLFLTYNKVRIATIDKFLFPEFSIPRSSFFLYKQVCPLTDYGIKLDDGDNPATNQYLSYWNEWTEEEYIYVHKNGGLIEPNCGWHITKEGQLNYYSLGLSRAPHQLKPSYLKLKGKKKIKKAGKLISLRDTGDENYFHFYNDVLAKLFFLKQNGFAIDQYHILVARVQAEKPFFTFYRERHPELKKLNWLIQDTEYIEANEIIFAKPETHRMDLLQQIVAPFKLPGSLSKAADVKVFLSRDPKRLRFIENMDELRPVLHEYRYNVTDADNLNMQEQIALFEKTNYLIGIHGAGFTNLLYANHIKVLVEIFPPTSEPWLPFHYGLMAKQLGIKYIPVIGSPARKALSGGFRLDPLALKKIIGSMG